MFKKLLIAGSLSLAVVAMPAMAEKKKVIPPAQPIPVMPQASPQLPSFLQQLFRSLVVSPDAPCYMAPTPIESQFAEGRKVHAIVCELGIALQPRQEAPSTAPGQAPNAAPTPQAPKEEGDQTPDAPIVNQQHHRYEKVKPDNFGHWNT